MQATKLRYQEWTEKGYQHAFYGREYNVVKGAEREKSIQKLKQELGLEHILIARQQHTDSFVEISNLEELRKVQEAKNFFDAIILKNVKNFSNIGIGVTTADCLPILVRSKDIAAVIHAGWQGLANRITSKTIQRIMEYDRDVKLLVGPAAGKDDYEFGEDDLEKIGSHVVFKNKDNRIYLNMIETLKAELNFLSVTAHSLNVSTISDNRFYSYRNEKEKAGRNLSLLYL